MAKVCEVPDCEKPTKGYRKMCGMHLSRLARHGDLNWQRKRRPVTDTHAWCNKGQHMVEHDGFAKGQRMCKECRKVYNRNNYSQGKACSDCGIAVNNASKGRCRQCAPKAMRKPPEQGLRWINVQGYAVLNSQWGRPNVNHRGQVLEHVKVMSDMLGRALLPGENVHHINGVRDDNRPENLELWSTSQPSGQRVIDKVQWAKELLSLYEPEALAQPMLTAVEGEAA